MSSTTRALFYSCEADVFDVADPSRDGRPCGRDHARWVHAARRYLCDPCRVADLEARTPHCPHAPDGPACAWCREQLGLPSAAPKSAERVVVGAGRGPAHAPPAFAGYDPVAIVAASMEPAPARGTWASTVGVHPAVLIGALHAPAGPPPRGSTHTAAGVPIVDHAFRLAPDAPEPETCAVCGYKPRASWHVATVFADAPAALAEPAPPNAPPRAGDGFATLRDIERKRREIVAMVAAIDGRARINVAVRVAQIGTHAAPRWEATVVARGRTIIRSWDSEYLALAMLHERVYQDAAECEADIAAARAGRPLLGEKEGRT